MKALVSEEKRGEMLGALCEKVIKFETDEVVRLANEVLAIGMDPYDAIVNGLCKGMEICGDLYEKGEYYVPEILMASEALNAGLSILQPHVKERNMGVKGEIIIGVVEGDIHDIGKNIVKMMFEAAGFKVHDLGRDVPLEKFLEEQLSTDADIVAVSAMMTTTMPGMKTVIDKIKEKNPNALIMIGGAPVSEKVKGLYRADGYAKDATSAVVEATRLLKSIREMGLKKERQTK